MYSVCFPDILKYKVIMCFKILRVIFHENSLNQHKEKSTFIFATFHTKRVKRLPLRNGLIKQHSVYSSFVMAELFVELKRTSCVY